MALTRDFHETVRDRARRDPEYRECLLKEGVGCLLAGEVDVAKIVFRDYIEAVVGFEQLSAMTGKPPESLKQLLSPQGDPGARSLFEVIACILRHEGLALQVTTVREDRDSEDREVVESVPAR